MTNPSPGTVLLVAFMVWAYYRRIRRNIGRQKLRPARIIVSMVILGIVSLLMLATAIVMPLLALGFFGGAVVGAALAFFLGLRHTKFETTEEGHFYTPNTYIGLSLSFLLIGRVAYRMLMLHGDAFPTYQPGHPPPMQSPLTMVILGLTIGYYLAYSIGLFVHTHDKKAAAPVS